jgi:eukaryotic-like serine/threonine-protein kinase
MTNQVLQNRYQIIHRLSDKGGFGITYIAKDLQTNFNCVVKELRLQHSNHEKAKELFEREAKVLQLLGSHQQIPTFIDYFHINQQFYLVQELIEGISLSDELKQRNTLTENDVIQLLNNILDPLVFVHQNQIIHRDLKPDNLIRRTKDQKIVLIDFGAVKQIVTQMGYTPPTQIYTPGYAATEQINGNPQFSSDIYALGIIAIQALTGISPATSNQNLSDVWRSQFKSKINPKFANIIEKMIDDNWQKRYQNASEVLQLLKSLTSANTNNNQPIQCPACLTNNPGNVSHCSACGYPLQTSPTPTPTSAYHLSANTLLKQGTYKIEKILGEGGFGITYQGIYTPNNAPVAIKELWPEKSARQGNAIMWAASITPQERQQQIHKFRLEASNQQKCSHPNIPKIYECFEENNTVYIVMEFITGKSLYQILQKEGILSEARVKKYFLQVAEALKLIHQNNFLHRDIKPDNIIINQQDQAVLIDFGATKEFIAGQTREMSQTLTKGYAPLEQYSYKSKRFPATDIYALCASMYELLTGELPAEAVLRVPTDSLISPRQINPQISQLMEKIILKGMKMNVVERFQTAEELIEAFDPTILHNKAKNLVKNNQLLEAIKIYEQCLINDPNNGQINLELAIVKLHTNNNQAEINAQKAVQLLGNNATAYGILGLIKCRQQNWTEAVNYLQKAVSLAPQEVWIKANLAWALGKINQWQQAENTVNQTLQIDHNCIFALGVKSWISVNQQNWQFAVGSATKAILLSQQNPNYYHQEIQKWVYPHLILALDLVPKTNPNTQTIANKRLDEFLSQFPNHSFALGFKGWQEAKLGLYNDAISYCNQALNQPDFPLWVLINTGIIQEYLNDFQSAIQTYSRNSSQTAFTLFRLGTLTAKMGQWQQAKSYLEEAIKLKPDYAEAYHNLGWVLLNIRTPDGSIENFRQLLAVYQQAIDFYTQQNKLNFAQNIQQSFKSAGVSL